MIISDDNNRRETFGAAALRMKYRLPVSKVYAHRYQDIPNPSTYIYIIIGKSISHDSFSIRK